MLLALVVAVAGAADLRGLAVSDGDPRRASYRAVAELVDRYPEGTTIASFEVGYLGYFSHRRVLDLLGLVTPEAPLEAVRRGDLAAVRDRLAPDLVMLPLNAGGLFESTIGEPRRFVAGYRLDRLQLEGYPHLAVYRRAGLDGRGEVVLDLLPGLAEAGARLEVAGFAQEAGIVAVLAPGEARSVELAAGPALRFQAGLAAPRGRRRGDARARRPASESGIRSTRHRGRGAELAGLERRGAAARRERPLDARLRRDLRRPLLDRSAPPRPAARAGRARSDARTQTRSSRTPRFARWAKSSAKAVASRPITSGGTMPVARSVPAASRRRAAVAV